MKKNLIKSPSAARRRVFSLTAENFSAKLRNEMEFDSYKGLKTKQSRKRQAEKRSLRQKKFLGKFLS